ncbi:MAG: acyl transferase [Bacteroidota bacterium]|nr:acyl transferase [Bacteroidota bacterium]
MDTFKGFTRDLYSINESTFDDIALQLFHFQAENNPVYKEYLTHLQLDINAVNSASAIPFLPISFFKNHVVRTGDWKAETVFSSSGTTGHRASTHSVKNLRFYLDHSVRCFEYFFGDIGQFHFLALLPSYLERSDSSLVAMMEYFIQKSRSHYSGFYLHDTEKLLKDLEKLKKGSKKTVLWGVTFALLDLAERYHPDLSHCMVFETGGMKGTRPEITRSELHAILKTGFGVDAVFSEYGMTELLSQAYSRGKNVFSCPPWMKIVGRDMTDPFKNGLLNETAGINVMDFANFDSAVFIETEDMGRVCEDGSFEILGRLDNSDVRGCNLMVE